MKENPAIGILKTSEYNNSIGFHIECDCASPTHSAKMWVESDAGRISISFFVTTTSTFWREGFSRIKTAWNVLFKGYDEQEHQLLLNKQAALNLAAVINDSVSKLESPIISK